MILGESTAYNIKTDLFVIFSGDVDGVNAFVYLAAPFITWKFVIFPPKDEPFEGDPSTPIISGAEEAEKS